MHIKTLYPNTLNKLQGQMIFNNSKPQIFQILFLLNIIFFEKFIGNKKN
jgi:hypothetical protein